MLCLLSRYIPRASSRETALSTLLSTSLPSYRAGVVVVVVVVAVSRPVPGRGCSRCVYPGSGTLSPDERYGTTGNVNDDGNDDDDDDDGDDDDDDVDGSTIGIVDTRSAFASSARVYLRRTSFLPVSRLRFD